MPPRLVGQSLTGALNEAQVNRTEQGSCPAMSRDVRRALIKALFLVKVTFQGPFLGFSWSGSVRGSRRASPSRVRQEAEAAPGTYRLSRPALQAY